MDSNNIFSKSEIIGVLLPGLMFVWLFRVTEPSLFQEFFGNDISSGVAILIIPISYAFGQLIKGLGFGYRNFYWRLFGGQPTNWIITIQDLNAKIITVRFRSPITNEARIELVQNLANLKFIDSTTLTFDENNLLTCSLSISHWHRIVRQMRHTLDQNGKHGKTREYSNLISFSQSMSMVCLLHGGLVFFTNYFSNHRIDWNYIFILLGGFCIFSYMIYHYGRFYAESLFTAFNEFNRKQL